ncbi:phosphotransferase family protein [Paludisphaera rhizosphaerae]|uniref:phosphotransferase family protein n=1 Tax=Paludisphaera rhizosphaerae TaxID=2711216 RepID=UPI0013EC4919|nr:aminoglycoside phosphotransferase family protein [Paludisphaera rhizosphaerae]
MRELTAGDAADYLRSSGRLPAGVAVSVRELSGGVSNLVLRVDAEDRPPFVVKQCRERLRVALEWRARLDRIWVEHATLRVLGELLPPGAVPELLFEDRDEYLFAMSCAPDDSETWKTRLLRGDADPAIAAALGGYLATIHSDAPNHPTRDASLADTSLFDELRVDPYYRTTARAHPRLAPQFDALIAAMEPPIERRALVLGDFSPKNILVHSGGLVLLDFECAHLGDPGFDLGFFMSHLALKRIHGVISDEQYRRLADGFLGTYFERLGDRLGSSEDVERRGVAHTAACLLARVDGKSPVEYLDGPGREVARRSALALFAQAPDRWEFLHRVLDSEARVHPR